MFLSLLKLTNFRNYSDLKHEFKTLVTVLVGNNAQGKTNFLESIYFLATTKSPRAERESELIKYGENVLRAEGKLDQNQLEIAMQIIDPALKKLIKVNGIPRRVVDYSENLAVVMFSPQDLNLVIGAPGLRRHYLDLTLSQTDREYKKAVTEYEDIVIRKNRLLKAIKEGTAQINELTYWSSQQVILASTIVRKRKDFFGFINQSERQFGNFSFQYLESVISTDRLQEYQTRETAAAASLIGPHRDDFHFILENRDLAKFGSRGEQRTAVLDLKIAEADFVASKMGERPVLLLDDIFSELDLKHREHVIGIVSLQQTIITAIELDNYLQKRLARATFLFVENGSVTGIAGR